MDKIRSLIDRGDDCVKNKKYEKALEFYREAVGFIPEPFQDQEISTEIIIAIGDVYFLMNEYEKANKAFSDVMLLPGATANPYIRLRRGQIAFEQDDIKRAKIELACAYMNGGEEIFIDEDLKYLNFIKPIISDAV